MCYLLRSRKHRSQYKITENETTTYTYSFRSVRLYWGHCCASNSQDMNSMQSLRQLRLKPDAPLNPAGNAHAKEWVVACTKQKSRMVHISTELRTYQGALVRLLPTRAGRSTTSHGQHSYGEGKKGKEKLLLPHQNLMIKVKARRFPPPHTYTKPHLADCMLFDVSRVSLGEKQTICPSQRATEDGMRPAAGRSYWKCCVQGAWPCRRFPPSGASTRDGVLNKTKLNRSWGIQNTGVLNKVK